MVEVCLYTSIQVCVYVDLLVQYGWGSRVKVHNKELFTNVSSDNNLYSIK